MTNKTDITEQFTTINSLSNNVGTEVERDGFSGTWYNFTDCYVINILKEYVEKGSKLQGKNSNHHVVDTDEDGATTIYLSSEHIEQYVNDILTAALLSNYRTDSDVNNFVKFLCNNFSVFDKNTETLDFAQYYAYLIQLLNDKVLLINKDSEHVDDWTVTKPVGIEITGGMFSPPMINVHGKSTMAYGDGVITVNTTFMVGFKDSYDFNDLEVDMLSDDDKLAIIENRKEVMKGYHSCMYKTIYGAIKKPSMFGSRTNFAYTERAIVDAESCAMIDYHSYSGIIGLAGLNHDADPDVTPLEEVTDMDYLLLDNSVVVYNLRDKQWGLTTFSTVNDIVFRDDAFDKLILDSHKKRLLSAIVHEHKVENMDFIDNKSGNGIILLHGVAGTGKTLTAESVAETTRKPLYKVSLGELGVDLDSLEENLTQILSLCERWDAILLIDEADVFLEERTSNDLERNAMVAVFLRLLEYYNGIMFLTTNRAMNFDSAFTSRITLAIEYKRPESYRMWASLLELSNIQLSDSEINTLCQTNLNGRQIKNCINSAKSLAKFEKASKVDVTHLEPFIHETKQFNKFMQKDTTV